MSYGPVTKSECATPVDRCQDFRDLLGSARNHLDQYVCPRYRHVRNLSIELLTWNRPAALNSHIQPSRFSGVPLGNRACLPAGRSACLLAAGLPLPWLNVLARRPALEIIIANP